MAHAGDAGARDILADRLGCVRAFLRTISQRLSLPLEAADLDELTQDAVLSMWRKLEGFSGTSSVETWAYGFCLNEVRKWKRTKFRGEGFVVTGGDHSPDEMPSPDEEPADLSYVLECLDRLGRPASEVIRLKHFEDMTFEQIGERMDFSTGTTKSLYYRGLQKLKGMLKTTWSQEQP